MKKLTVLAIAVIVTVLSGCGGGMSGTYKQKGGMMSMVSGDGSMTFKSGNKVDFSMGGTSTECTYEKDGDKLKVINGDQNQIFTIDKEGCIDGGSMLGKFCKEN